MPNLTGEFECKIDAKGRLKLPMQLIRQLGGDVSLNFTLNRGFENCLNLFPKNVWDRKTKEISQLNTYIQKNRVFVRYFHRGATPVATDAADRILIPKSLMQYAGISKEVILLAYNDQIEIWSKEAYEHMINNEPKDFGELAEEVFGGLSSDD